MRQDVPLLPLLGTSGSLEQEKPNERLLRRPKQHRSALACWGTPQKLIPETDCRTVNFRDEATENDSQKYGEVSVDFAAYYTSANQYERFPKSSRFPTPFYTKWMRQSANAGDSEQPISRRNRSGAFRVVRNRKFPGAQKKQSTDGAHQQGTEYLGPPPVRSSTCHAVFHPLGDFLLVPNDRAGTQLDLLGEGSSLMRSRRSCHRHRLWRQEKRWGSTTMAQQGEQSLMTELLSCLQMAVRSPVLPYACKEATVLPPQ